MEEIEKKESDKYLYTFKSLKQKRDLKTLASKRGASIGYLVDCALQLAYPEIFGKFNLNDFKKELK